jgi:hypothetical protein
MIEHQNRPIREADKCERTEIRQGAETLLLTLAYERLIHKGIARNEAVHTLANLNKNFSPEFFEALVTLDPNAEEGDLRKCRIEQLTPGMIIQSEIHTAEGTLLVARGQAVNAPLLSKLKNFQARRVIAGKVTVSRAITTLSFVKGAS